MKTEYRHFTAEERQRARQTDLVSFLQSRGKIVKRSGSEWAWMNASQKVTIRGNLWFHQYERVGGDAVSFVQKFFGLDYPQGVALLLTGVWAPLAADVCLRKKVFSLPPANDNLRRVYAYLLNARGIDRDVLRAFIRQSMIYESADYHNAVFVGFDLKGIPRHAHKRSTASGSSYKGNAPESNPCYSFHWNGKSDQLYLFEAPVDMLSFISLHKDGWQHHSYAAACCVGDQVLFQMLTDNPKLTKIFLCLDNDKAGQAANLRIAQKLSQFNIYTEILVPNLKDWNEDLLSVNEREKKICALSF